MRIALLNTQPLIRDWFSQAYPGVPVFAEASREFMEAEHLLLLSWYEIEEQHYQVIHLWEKYLRLRANAKKLIVLGWLPFSRGNNYLQVGKMPNDLTEKLKNAERLRQKPPYPVLAERDIVLDLERILHSHGQRAFQKLLGRTQPLLRRIEKKMQEGASRARILEMNELHEASELMDRLFRVWNERKVYFQLMPQYVGLSQFEHIWQQWLLLRDQAQTLQPRLSVQIGQYVNDVIIEDILRVYGMEKMP